MNMIQRELSRRSTQGGERARKGRERETRRQIARCSRVRGSSRAPHAYPPYSYMIVLIMSHGTSGGMVPDSRTAPPSHHSLHTFRVSVLPPTATLARRPSTPPVKLRSPTACECSFSAIHALKVMQRASPANTTASVVVMRPQLRP